MKISRIKQRRAYGAFTFFTCLVVLFMAFPTDVYGATQENKIKVHLDNYPLSFPIEPRIAYASDGTGHTVVPFRKIAEALGVQVEWDSRTQTIHAYEHGKVVLLPLGNIEAQVNGTAYILPVAPFTDQGHTLIPLRFFSEVFGAQVDWDGKNNTVIIQSSSKKMETLAFYGLGSVNHRHYIPHFDSMVYTWSRINQQGEFTTSSANQNEYFWPQPLAHESIEELIARGTDVGGEAYLMVAAFESKGEVSSLLLNDEKVAKAIEEMVTLAVNKNLDGIVLDFEGIKNTADHQELKLAYTIFVEKLTNETRKKGMKVGLAVPPPNNFYSGYEYQKLGELTDYIFLMAYDYPKQDKYSPEPLSFVNQGIEQTLEQIPAHKLILGISLPYETPETTQHKIGLAKRHQLKGVGFWILKNLTDEYMNSIHQATPLKQWPLQK